jgi:hypothetical protein
MSDPGVTWLYDALQAIRAEVRDGHHRLRQDMNAGFDKLDHQIRVQNGRVGTVEDKVLVIETERKAEAGDAIKKGTLAGLLGAGGLAGIVEAMRQWWP